MAHAKESYPQIHFLFHNNKHCCLGSSSSKRAWLIQIFWVVDPKKVWFGLIIPICNQFGVRLSLKGSKWCSQARLDTRRPTPMLIDDWNGWVLPLLLEVSAGPRTREERDEGREGGRKEGREWGVWERDSGMCVVVVLVLPALDPPPYCHPLSSQICVHRPDKNHHHTRLTSIMLWM